MLFAVGTKVQLRNTGDIGTISEILGDGIFSVYLSEEDMEIPAFEDNLMRVGKESNTAQFVPAKQKKTTAPPSRPIPNVQYRSLNSKGLLLAFDPEYHHDSTTKHYVIHLINDTKEQLVFNFELYLEDDDLLLEHSGQIEPHSLKELGKLLGDELNEHPEVEIDVWKATTEGRKAQRHKLLKIKPKQFFKNLKSTIFLSKKVHLYTLFERLDEVQQNDFQEDLKNYTKQNIGSFRRDKQNPFYGIHDVVEFAEFNTEIDLHIEQLVDTVEGLDRRQIVHIQMQHFEQFIAKAIRLGVPNVFVIHGVGEGKLRDRIAQRLQQHPQVRSFKNEYHHRYGFGATEVRF